MNFEVQPKPRGDISPWTFLAGALAAFFLTFLVSFCIEQQREAEELDKLPKFYVECVHGDSGKGPETRCVIWDEKPYTEESK